MTSYSFCHVSLRAYEKMRVNVETHILELSLRSLWLHSSLRRCGEPLRGSLGDTLETTLMMPSCLEPLPRKAIHKPGDDLVFLSSSPHAKGWYSSWVTRLLHGDRMEPGRALTVWRQGCRCTPCYCSNYRWTASASGCLPSTSYWRNYSVSLDLPLHG